MITIMSDAALRAENVPEDIIQRRAHLNELIACGKKMWLDIITGEHVECTRAFVSNPHGYYKVFLKTTIGEILEHFSG